MESAINLVEDQRNEIIRQYHLLITHADILKGREYPLGESYNERDEYMRDYARILYSPSFRRLQGKMQIMGVQSSAFYRNRLTHSLEVAQIATSIAKLLSAACGDDEMYNKDIFVIQAAALAHDIGHPAFGHKGERVLNNLEKSIHFEGNAQNFRILRSLEKKDPDHGGLNLTYRTLLSINKYNVPYSDKEGNIAEKFMYDDDYKILQDVRNRCGLSRIRTLDVQIIEIADDIAYAVHDLEDGLAFRKFTIDEIAFCLKKEDETVYNQFRELVKEAQNHANKIESVKNLQEHSKLLRMKLTSLLTDKFICDITLDKIDEDITTEHGTEKGVQELSLCNYKNLMRKLKKVIFECITRDDDIFLYEARGEVVLRSLYNIYSDIDIDRDGKLMPPDHRPTIAYKECKTAEQKEEYKKQLCQNSIDYIAGMMDTYAIKEYERLFNRPFSAIELNDNDN